MAVQDFQARIEGRRDKLLAEAERITARQNVEIPVIPKEGPITCFDCSAQLGYISLVRRYCTHHYLIVDELLHEKVTPFPDKAFMPEVDGKSKIQIFCYCSLCSLKHVPN